MKDYIIIEPNMIPWLVLFGFISFLSYGMVIWYLIELDTYINKKFKRITDEYSSNANKKQA